MGGYGVPENCVHVTLELAFSNSGLPRSYCPRQIEFFPPYFTLHFESVVFLKEHYKDKVACIKRQHWSNGGLCFDLWLSPYQVRTILRVRSSNNEIDGQSTGTARLSRRTILTRGTAGAVQGLRDTGRVKRQRSYSVVQYSEVESFGWHTLSMMREWHGIGWDPILEN